MMEIRKSSEPGFDEMPRWEPPPRPGSALGSFAIEMIVVVVAFICPLTVGLLWLLQQGPW